MRACSSDYSREMQLDGMPYPGLYLSGQDAMALARVLSSDEPEAKAFRNYVASYGSQSVVQFILMTNHVWKEHERTA